MPEEKRRLATTGIITKLPSGGWRTYYDYPLNVRMGERVVEDCNFETGIVVARIVPDDGAASEKLDA